jgi:uncharacterized iron-regulated membrane protein
MYPAMCFDEGMLISMLLGLLVLGVLCCTPVVFAFVALVRWADARQKRTAAESPILR